MVLDRMDDTGSMSCMFVSLKPALLIQLDFGGHDVVACKGGGRVTKKSGFPAPNFAAANPDHFVTHLSWLFRDANPNLRQIRPKTDQEPNSTANQTNFLSSSPLGCIPVISDQASSMPTSLPKGRRHKYCDVKRGQPRNTGRCPK